MVGYTRLRENSTSILDWDKEFPKEFIEIWKNVSLRLILKDKGGITIFTILVILITW